jgi:hypothetical protein
MKFSKLQYFADRLVSDAADQEAVLCEFFSHYLNDEERRAPLHRSTKIRA